MPCGKCEGCRKSRAREWALRCKLESSGHQSTAFLTLTYNDEHLPHTLSKQHYADFIRQLRKQHAKRHQTTGLIRHFGSGEYGEQNQRPHYHALIFGLHISERDLVEQAWNKGFTTVEEVTDARIAYCAGYTSKKLAYRDRVHGSAIIDYETGEYLGKWQSPFLQMSRNPGIGYTAAMRHAKSWRHFAVHQDGYRIPVPRYYHDAWLLTATPEQIEQLVEEKLRYALNRDTSQARLDAQEQIDKAQHATRSQARKL